MDGFTERSAALRDSVNIEGFDALPEGGIIDRQRALEEGIAGEGDQA
jgi:hypothetical protein